MAASIFISFAGQDLKAASAICEALEARGFSCWLSHRDIPAGESFQVSIVRAIRGARAMVLVFTQNSNRSAEVAKELALASQSALPVVPLRIEAVIPNEAFAYEFATRQWIDFSHGWDAGLEQLCQRLTVMLPDDKPGDAPPIPSPAQRRRGPARWPFVAGALALVVAVVAAGAYFATRAPSPRPAVAVSPPAAAPSRPPASTNDVPF